MNSSHSSQGLKVKGAMPCGNPKRYGSREVVPMARGEKKSKLDDEEAHAGTESERHIELMVHRQLNTDISLTGQFSQHREFSAATAHDPGVDHLTGLTRLSDYKQVEELDSRIDELRHCGLTDGEIVLKLKEDMKREMGKSQGGLGVDPLVQAQRLSEIEQKMKDKASILRQPDSFKGALELSRQERDLEKAMAQRYGKDSVLPKAMTTSKKFADTHPDDPINQIGDILRGVEGEKLRDSRRERRRRRKQEKRMEYYSQFETLGTSGGKASLPNREELTESIVLCADSHSDSDSDEQKECILPQPREYYSNNTNTTRTQQSPCHDSSKLESPDSNSESKGHGSPSKTVLAPHPVDSGFSGKNVPELNSSCVHRLTEGADQVKESSIENSVVKCLSNSVSLISEEEIVKNRLTEKEILGMDRFRTYERGLPNKTLYVKNLHNKVTEEELISLFGRFQDLDAKAPKLVYKLLTGRMKGQAFITFPDECVAGKAIDLLNGYKLKDRPVIISFGKQQS